jgi:hypothetical protein
MTQNEVTQTKPKIEIQYSGDDSYLANKILLEFTSDKRIFMVGYDDSSEKMVAHFVYQDPKVNDSTRESEQWALGKEDFQSGNTRFKIVIGQSMWRFQRIKKQIEVTEIRGVIRKLSSDRIVYEYAAPLANLSKIEIVND